MTSYIHKKTGKKYYLLRWGMDCTNERNGLVVAIYMGAGPRVYVREKREFLRKFEEEMEVE